MVAGNRSIDDATIELQTLTFIGVTVSLEVTN